MGKGLSFVSKYTESNADSFAETLISLLTEPKIFISALELEGFKVCINIEAEQLLNYNGMLLLSACVIKDIQSNSIFIIDKYRGYAAEICKNACIYKYRKTIIIDNNEETKENQDELLFFKEYSVPEDRYDLLVWCAVYDELIKTAEQSETKNNPELLGVFKSILNKMLKDSVNFALYIFIFNEILPKGREAFKLSIDISRIREQGIGILKENDSAVYIESKNVKYPVIRLADILYEYYNF